MHAATYLTFAPLLIITAIGAVTLIIVFGGLPRIGLVALFIAVALAAVVHGLL